MRRKQKMILLVDLLVRRGLCTSPKEAKGWIMAGRVVVNDQRIDKAGQKVPEEAEVRIKGISKYVGKGGFKLEGALSDFNMSVSGRVVLDAGVSTGGFTDCLLQHGATKVYTVDVGHGTLAGRLRSDNRVVVFERTNISELSPEQFDPLPSLATVDLSYISLKKAIPIVADLLEPDGEMVCLVKPLFEVPDSYARRCGRIDDPAAYEDVLHDLQHFIESLGFKTVDMTHSHVTGNRGTREFFLRISKDPETEIRGFDIKAIIESALKLPLWKTAPFG